MVELNSRVDMECRVIDRDEDKWHLSEIKEKFILRDCMNRFK